MSRDLLGVESGLVIADRYRVEALIGRGAMGAVWRATHVRLNSPVAIKFLNPAIANDQEMLERFMREAQSAALVRSTHVVQIFDYGVERGTPYIAMELLVGQSLENRLLERGPLGAVELDKIFVEVARAVDVAHEVGVIHRDLKPGNVFIAREAGHEITKVLDFGIAKLLDQTLARPLEHGTHTGIVLGTPYYMSPEQARGSRNVDHRSDLWALAVLAFECLTGKLPFEGEALGDLMVNICVSSPRVPSSLARVPEGFDAWFLQGVKKDPKQRFATARDMAMALHRIVEASASGRSRSRSVPELDLGTGRSALLGGGAQRESLADAAPSVEREVDSTPHGTLTAHGAASTDVSARPSTPPPGSRARKLFGVVAASSVAAALGWALLARRPAFEHHVPAAAAHASAEPARAAPDPQRVQTTAAANHPRPAEPVTAAVPGDEGSPEMAVPAAALAPAAQVSPARTSREAGTSIVEEPQAPVASAPRPARPQARSAPARRGPSAEASKSESAGPSSSRPGRSTSITEKAAPPPRDPFAERL